jgi:hypothetical protein
MNCCSSAPYLMENRRPFSLERSSKFLGLRGDREVGFLEAISVHLYYSMALSFINIMLWLIIINYVVYYNNYNRNETFLTSSQYQQESHYQSDL